MPDSLVWILCLLLGIVLVLVFRQLSRRRFKSNRVVLNLDVMYKEVANEVNYDTFKDVLFALGESYSIDPGILRISDTLEDLEKLDSWDIGTGTEKMNDWLQRKGVKTFDGSVRSVKDLLLAVQKATAQ